MANAANGLGYPVVDLPASTMASPETAVKFLVDYLVQSGRIEPEYAGLVSCQILHREKLGSAGVGRGVAIPHLKSEAVGEVVGVIGKSEIPMTWPGAVDSEPVGRVCLLVTPTSDPTTSLRALEAIARQLRGR